MRILPSQSSGTKRKVGSSSSLTISRSSPWRVADRLPVGEARAAERVDAEPQPGAADRVEVDHGGEVVDVGGHVVAPGDRRRPRTGRAGCSPQPSSSSALASSWIQPVTSVSAGPPCGGLYLKPPSPGGLCDGVTTMPSAVVAPPPRLWVRIACEITGVGGRAVVGVDHDVDAVGGEHLDDRAERRPGQRVRVAAEEERPVDALLGAVACRRRR